MPFCGQRASSACWPKPSSPSLACTVEALQGLQWDAEA
jgi:hypothetical protein